MNDFCEIYFWYIVAYLIAGWACGIIAVRPEMKRIPNGFVDYIMGAGTVIVFPAFAPLWLLGRILFWGL